MKDFLNEHFNVLFLGFLAIMAWAATMNLIRTPGIAPENVSWAREQAGGIIYALLALMTGFKLGQLSNSASPPKPTKGPDAPNTPDEGNK